MKRLLLFLIAGFSAFAQPVRHAVLNETMDQIVDYVRIDPGLVAAYLADPEKASKVARLRIVVETPRPDITIQQTVEDGGYSITESNVVRVWNVRQLTTEEIASRNSAAVEEVAGVLDNKIRGTNWAGLARVTSLQSELMGKQIQLQLLNCELLLLVTKAVAGTVATNNLTTQERARVGSLRTQLSFPRQSDFTQEDIDRVVSIRNELIKAYQLWKAAQTARQVIASTNIVITANDTNLWPSIEIGE